MLSSAVFGQSGSSEINGTITDASGAATPGVTVTITNPSTGLVRILKTNEQGIYSAPALNPGIY